MLDRGGLEQFPRDKRRIQVRLNMFGLVSAPETCCSRVTKKGSNGRSNIDSLENIVYVAGIRTTYTDLGICHPARIITLRGGSKVVHHTVPLDTAHMYTGGQQHLQVKNLWI